MSQKDVRDHEARLAALAAEYGATTVFVRGKKHPCVLVTTAEGKKFRIVFSLTPSDYHSYSNNLQDMRRYLKANGAVKREQDMRRREVPARKSNSVS